MNRSRSPSIVSRLGGCWALVLLLVFGCAHRPPELTWQLRHRYHYGGSLADLERDAAQALRGLDVDLVGVSPHRLAIRPRHTNEAEVQLRLRDGILYAQNMVADHDSIEQRNVGQEILRRVREIPNLGRALTADEARNARAGGRTTPPPTTTTAPAPTVGNTPSTPPSPEPGRGSGRRRRPPRR